MSILSIQQFYYYNPSEKNITVLKEFVNSNKFIPLHTHLNFLRSGQFSSRSDYSVDGWIIAEAEVLDQTIASKSKKLDLLNFKIENTNKQLEEICIKRENTNKRQNEEVIELTEKYIKLGNTIEDKNLEKDVINYKIQLLNDELQSKENRMNEIVGFLNRINVEPDQEHLIYRRETEKPLNVLLFVLMLIISLTILWGLIGKYKMPNESYTESSSLLIITTHEKFR